MIARLVFPLVAISLLCATTASADKMTQMLERWSKATVEIADGVCANESKKVKKKLKYVAVLLIHNEIGEAMQVLHITAEIAGSEECKAAIVKGKAPPR